MTTAVKLRDVVVLGLLNEHPRYGYELKTIIDHLMSHIIDISSGSLYYGLKKLLQDGFIAEEATEKVGRRPERSVYRITPAGQQMLSTELPLVIFPQAQPYFPLDLALYFFNQMDPVQCARRLSMRAMFLKEMSGCLDEIELRYGGMASPAQLLILTHSRQYMKMEHEFLQQVLKSATSPVGYKLTDDDKREVRAEIESFKLLVRPEVGLTQLSGANSAD